LAALHLVGAEEADEAAGEGERGYRFVAEEDAEGEGDYGDEERRAGGAAGGEVAGGLRHDYVGDGGEADCHGLGAPDDGDGAVLLLQAADDCHDDCAGKPGGD